MSKLKSTYLENEKPFSQSLFWQGQRQFYHEKGAEAWAAEVPFYITSNPFIAHNYAMIIIRFIQDWLQKSKEAKNYPFFIVELGSGSGQFSFYLLKNLTRLQSELNLSNVKIQYIMTDFTESNIKFWKNHPQLAPFIENKMLDFSLFDLEKNADIVTIQQKIKINQNTCQNPLIVIANYLFDSIINDIFYINNNKVYESLVSLKTTSKNLKNNIPKDWEKVSIQHQEKIITGEYYHHPTFDKILKNYAANLDDTYLLFPIGCLRGVERLQKLCNNRLLLISSDKGYTQLQELRNQTFPELDFHGSFSLMVNYHAIENYFEMNQGSSFMQTSRSNIASVVFSSGFKLNELSETYHLLNETIEGFSPSDFFNFYELIEKKVQSMNLNALASILCLSRWDPALFEHMCERISKLLAKEDSEMVDYVVNHLDHVIDNFYYIPACDDIFFSVGYLLYNLDQFDAAIEYYLQSEQYFPATFELLYNIALCYFYKKSYGLATKTLQQALKLNPKNREARNLLKSIPK